MVVSIKTKSPYKLIELHVIMFSNLKYNSDNHHIDVDEKDNNLLR